MSGSASAIAIATRRNDSDVGVANRELWTVVGCAAAERSRSSVTPGAARCQLPYADEHVELAYATTAYGAQGSTVPTSHVLVGEHTGAASAYVGMTRGRERNVAHLVAESIDDARRQWVEVFGRDRADLGPAHAARPPPMTSTATARHAPRRRPATRPQAPDAQGPAASYRRPETSGPAHRFTRTQVCRSRTGSTWARA